MVGGYLFIEGWVLINLSYLQDRRLSLIPGGHPFKIGRLIK